MAAVELVLNHHQGVVAFLQRLAVEVTGQLRQILAVKPNSHCKVLVGCGKLVADLLGQQFIERLGHHTLLGVVYGPKKWA